MLQRLRENISGWLLWLIVGIVCLSFILWGTESLFSSNKATSSKVVATVNGEEIQAAEIERISQQIGHDVLTENKLAQLPEQLKPIIAARALENAILSKVMLTSMDKLGLGVSREDIDMEIASIPVFQQEGQFSQAVFERVIRQLGYASIESFINTIKSSKALSQLSAGVRLSEIDYQTDIDTFVSIAYEKRDFSYLSLPISKFTDSEITEQEIKEFYAAHAAAFMLPEQLKVSYIHVNLAKMAADLVVTEQQIVEYYEDNLSQFQQPKQWKLAHIWLQGQEGATLTAMADKVKQGLDRGVPFATLAKQYSADNATADAGGELDWLSLDSMQDELAAVILAELKQIGDIATYQGQGGIEIFKLVEVKESGPLELRKVRSEIMSLLKRQAANKKYSILAEDLADLAFSNPKDLKQVAAQLQQELIETPYFTQQTAKELSLIKESAVLKALYSEEVYINGNNTEVIKLSDSLFVGRITNKKPAISQSLEQVKASIQEQLTTKKALEAGKLVTMDLAKKLDKGQNAQEIVRYALSWRAVKDSSQYTDEHDRALLELAFQAKPNKHLSGLSSDGKSYYIVRTDNVIQPKLHDLPELTKANVAHAVRSLHASSMLSALIKELQAQSDIVHSP